MSSSEKSDKDDRPECKYGGKCYRVNSEHLQKYKHPSSSSDLKGSKRKSTDEYEGSKKKRTSSVSPSKSENDRSESDDSDDEEETPLPESPQSPADNILQKFLVEMPPDFYSFWEFCKTLDSNQPECAILKSLGLRLVGPYDILSRNIKVKSRLPSEYLTLYRYYYDPPEFQTVLQGNEETQHHIGYFRDDPSEMPVFMAVNEAKKNGQITPIGDNIFAAVHIHLNKKLVNADNKILKKLQEQLLKWAKDHNFKLDEKTSKMKERDKKCVTTCLHRAGMVVPYNKKTKVGYRPLPETDNNLKKILQKIVDSKTETEKQKRFEPLQQLITFVQFANDECDYGMGLELGLDLFTFGYSGFHSVILSILPLAYELLGKPTFAKIAKAHLKNRLLTIS
ncbi:hypothetical protein CHUAL_002991 [Chamberlinius hualienensis]